MVIFYFCYFLEEFFRDIIEYNVIIVFVESLYLFRMILVLVFDENRKCVDLSCIIKVLLCSFVMEEINRYILIYRYK